MTKDQPLNPDVGLIFVEIIQPTRSSVDRAGMVAVCVDKLAVALDQAADLTAPIRRLVACSPSR
jgi:hypothetical protein